MLSSLRSGSWITRDRLIAYASLLLAGYVVAIIWILSTAHGHVDGWGRALGTDFSSLWSAGKLVLKGLPELVYDWQTHAAEQQRIFGESPLRYAGWLYPPPFLLIVAGLATMPYLPALLFWQGITLSFYLISIYLILRKPLALLAALAFPAVLINLLHGQNGFLTASFFAGGLYFLRTSPVFAGLLFGLLAYKPHFGLLLPLALAAGGHWRTFIAASATVTVLVAVSLVTLGEATWIAFLDGTTVTRKLVLETGGVGWHKVQSVFSMVRMLGGSVPLAYTIQIAVVLICSATVIRIWRSNTDFTLKAACLLTATLLASPFQLDYDLMILGAAIAFMVAHGIDNGFIGYQKSLMAFVWFTPLATRELARLIPVSLGVVAIAFLLALIVIRANSPPPSSPESGVDTLSFQAAE